MRRLIIANAASSRPFGEAGRPRSPTAPAPQVTARRPGEGGQPPRRRGSASLTAPLPPALAGGFFSRLRQWRAPLTAALLASIGLFLIGQGLWIHAKALLAQVLLERAFAASVSGGQPVKPWSWADTWPVARLEFPRLGASAVVLHGSSGQALAFGPAHVEATPEPGERGTAVYAAHRDTHFSFLGKLRAGDHFIVTRRDGARFEFRVTHTSIVRWDDSGIDPQAAGRHLVLVSCWPLDGNTPGALRYLVHAELSETGAERVDR